MGFLNLLKTYNIKRKINKNKDLRKRFNETVVKQKKELYYKEVQRFFDIGILREIYKSDLVSICNLANSYYLVFMFPTIDKDSIVGLVVNTIGAKEIVNNNYTFFKYFEYYDQSNLDKYMVALTDDLIRVFLPIMKKREEGNIGPNVDLNFEKELTQKSEF